MLARACGTSLAIMAILLFSAPGYVAPEVGTPNGLAAAAQVGVSMGGDSSSAQAYCSLLQASATGSGTSSSGGWTTATAYAVITGLATGNGQEDEDDDEGPGSSSASAFVSQLEPSSTYARGTGSAPGTGSDRSCQFPPICITCESGLLLMDLPNRIFSHVTQLLCMAPSPIGPYSVSGLLAWVDGTERLALVTEAGALIDLTAQPNLSLGLWTMTSVPPMQSLGIPMQARSDGNSCVVEIASH